MFCEHWFIVSHIGSIVATTVGNSVKRFNSDSFYRYRPPHRRGIQLRM